jgi:hypothetical protein
MSGKGINFLKIEPVLTMLVLKNLAIIDIIFKNIRQIYFLLIYAQYVSPDMYTQYMYSNTYNFFLLTFFSGCW